MGRISVTLSDDLKKKLRFKTIERFGGKKGDLTKAVAEAIATWITKEAEITFFGELVSETTCSQFTECHTLLRIIHTALDIRTTR